MSTLIADYERRTPFSRALSERARHAMPGGNTRTCAHFDPYPLALVRGSGPYVWDGDDNRYIDLNCNGMAIIHGQAFPPVVEALTRAAGQGTAWGGPSEQQVELAEILCERIASAEEVRFVASGTEAGMLATKVARRATGRTLLVKAIWGYHGGFDDLEAGLHHNGELPGRVRLARYGDAADFERVIAEEGERVAAIVIEPASVTGAVLPPPDFLPRLRAAADRVGALLILDECITYRTALGGLQSRIGVDPDLTMLGKFIGGGLPLGVVAGKRAVLDHLDPTRPDHLYHSGSYNGSRLATATGVATLRHLTAEATEQMNANAQTLERAVTEAATASGVPLTVSCVGSMVGFHFFTDEPKLDDGPLQARARAEFHLAAVNAGVFLVPWDGVCCVSTAVDAAVIAEAGERLGAALATCADELKRLGETQQEVVQR
ncbi:MAG TPA: aminotransferase class III-fold pyridoxal phosphate-dependent enzyme [Conexibacter sp.]|nr:aminotransferase class III-fold pyridoxal phosphate-dependent enzyme [Conexibacter sp.]